jgi:hypothetical protein
MRTNTEPPLRTETLQTKQAKRSRWGNNSLSNIHANWCPHFHPSFGLSTGAVPVLKVEINSGLYFVVLGQITFWNFIYRLQVQNYSFKWQLVSNIFFVLLLYKNSLCDLSSILIMRYMKQQNDVIILHLYSY